MDGHFNGLSVDVPTQHKHNVWVDKYTHFSVANEARRFVEYNNMKP